MNTFLFKVGLALPVLMLAAACQRETVAPPDNTPDVRALRTDEAKAVRSTNDFAFNAFAKLNAAQPAGSNQFISPFSVAMAVAMTRNGADGTTKAGIQAALGLDGLTDAETNSAFQSLSQYLAGLDRTVAFAPANSIWYRRTLTPQPAFVEANRTYFDAEVKGLDFAGDADGAKHTMNAWVKDKTQGKIEKIVETVVADHVMFLMNAVYFKGTWAYKFDKSLTADMPFHLENGTQVAHPFMRGKHTVTRHADDDKLLLNLPYGNRQFEMTLIMPREGKPLAGLLPQLTAANVAGWLARADSGSVEVLLPKFRFEGDYTKKEFNAILSELGMGEAFSDQADFSRLLVDFKKGDLKIDEVAHKTFVQVDEEGTEAAAVTSVGVVVTSLPETVAFNRPFVYLIREKSSGAVLFMGKMMNPAQEK